MRIALCGASGFIGTHICHALLKQGYNVIGIKRESSDLSISQKVFEELNRRDSVNFSHDDIEWKTADLRNPQALERALSSCEVVINAAAKVSFNPKQRKETIKNNIDVAANVVNACIATGVERLLHISSVSALPNPDKKFELDESFLNSTYYRFETSYGESKYRSEMEIWRGLGEGLKVTVFNPGIVLGEWKAEGSSNEPIAAVDKGLNFYSAGYSGFVDVQDIAQAIILSLENEQSIGERYVLVGHNESYEKFLKRIAEKLQVKGPSVKAGMFLSKLVAYIAKVPAFFTGKEPFITEELAESANRKTHFVNDKAKEELALDFHAFDKTIARSCRFYAEQNKNL